MIDRAILDSVIVILSKVWRIYVSMGSLCSLILQPQATNSMPTSTSNRYPHTDNLISVNQQVSVWCEQTAISLVMFLRQTSTEDVIAEVQAIAKNIAMTTRSFNQHLKQRSIVSPLEGVGLFPAGPKITSNDTYTPDTAAAATTVSLPPDFFLPSPTPPRSDSQDSSMESVSSTSSLV